MRRSVAALACLFFIACASRGRGPNLIDVTELGPRHLEVGDRVRVRGSGFPEGRPALVTFAGEVRRAGEKPREDVTVATPAQLVAPHALELVITPELAAKFCGAPDARHATFRGDVEVAFTPERASGSSVEGRLQGVVLDVSPESTAEQASLALANDGRRYAEFLGVELARSEEGLTVSGVRAQSRASRAGLVDGDVLVELDGLSLRSVADFIPPPNARSSELVVRRGPERQSVHVDSSGFRYSAPETLLVALIAVGLVLGLAGVFLSPLGRAIGFVERRCCDRLRDARTRAGAKRSPARALLNALAEQLPSSFVPYSLWLIESAMLTAFALGKSVVAFDLDILVLPLSTLSAFLLTTLITGGAESAWTLRRTLSRAFSVLLLNVPFLALLTSAAVSTGSLRPADLLQTQGPWPWQWAAFQHPALGALALCSLLSLVPRPGPVSPWQAFASSRRSRWLEWASWLHALAVAAVLALIAFGGFQTPLSARTPLALGFGAVLWLGKSWILLAIVGALRWTLGALDASTVRKSASALLIVPSGLALLASLLLTRVVPGPVLGTLQHAAAPVVTGVFFAAASVTVVRILQALRAPGADFGVQPWL